MSKKIKGEEFAERIIELYKDGLTPERTGNKVARENGLDDLSGYTVKKILVKNNVKIRSNRQAGKKNIEIWKGKRNGQRTNR